MCLLLYARYSQWQPRGCLRAAGMDGILGHGRYHEFLVIRLWQYRQLLPGTDSVSSILFKQNQETCHTVRRDVSAL